MIDIRRTQLPSIALVLVGLYLGVRRTVAYVQYALDPPSHRLGLLAEIVFLFFLLAAGVLIAIGIRGLRRERLALPTAVLVGVSILWGTFAVDLYSISSNTQFVVTLGLTVSTVPAVATYLFFRLRTIDTLG
ncbi:hypothetical protein ACOZ4I_11885 [Haloarcula salina]|uniref:hypothetical protein n=1 Tax=Haloarcula salina TaxID=1429914 RepID=UPI003C6FCE18